MVLKKVFPCVLVVTILCTFCLVLYQPPKVKADAGTDVLYAVTAGAGGTAFVVGAPIVAILAVTAVALGVIYQNQDQIQANGAAFFNWLYDKNVDFSNFFYTAYEHVEMSPDAVAYYKQFLITSKMEGSLLKTSKFIDSYTYSKTKLAHNYVHLFDSLPSKDTYIDVSYNLSPGCKFGFALMYGGPTDFESYYLDYGIFQNYSVGSTINGYKVFSLPASPIHFKYTTDGFVYLINSDGSLKKLNINAHKLTGSQYDCFYSFSSHIGDENLHVGINDTASIVVSSPYNTETVNVIGDVSGVDAQPYSKNPAVAVENGLSIPVTDVPASSIVGATAQTIDTTMDITTTATANPALTDPIADTSTINWNPLLITLKDKFPFCIPFDLIRVIADFRATRQAPVLRFEFPEQFFPGGGVIEIDFSKFDLLATILRLFEILAFTIFLIKITREKMIKG